MNSEEKTSFKNTKHGLSGSKFYYIWSNIKRRCTDPNANGWKHNGGKGIIICERWREFSNFMEDMFESYSKSARKFGEDNIRIDRENIRGNYDKNNCKWVTTKESLKSRNYATHYSDYKIEFEGKIMNIKGWNKLLGIPVDKIIQRIRRKPKSEHIFDAFMVYGLFYPQIWKGEKTRAEIVNEMAK